MRRPGDRRASSRWGRYQTVFDWVHYLRLLEHKPGALDYARPLKGLSLPDCFPLLRRRLEEADPEAGTVEFIRVLLLHEDFSREELAAAVQAALPLPTIKAADIRVLLERGREDPARPVEPGEPAASEGDPGGPRPI